MIGRRPIVLAASASITIAISFVAQWYLLTQFGASRQLDAYYAALAVPILMLYVVGEPLYRVATPKMAVIDGPEFKEFSWSLFRTVGAFFGVVAVVLGLTTGVWVRLLTPGFEPRQQDLAQLLVRWLLIGMLLQGISGAARSVWNAKHRFVFPAIASTSAAFISLVFLILTIKRLGVVAAAWAFDVRFLTECVLLVPVMGTYVRTRRDGRVAGQLFREARPLIIGASYARTDVLVDRVLASIAPVGSLSLLYLAQQIMAAISQVINQTFVAPASPVLAQLAHRRDWLGFRNALSRHAVRISIIVGLIALSIPFGGPALRLVFAHRNMDPQHIHLLTILMIALLGLLVGDSLAYLVNTAFYAIGNTRTPAIATGVVYSAVVPLKIGVFAVAGIVGLAVCTSGYYVVNLIVLAYLLQRTLRSPTHRAGEVARPILQPSPPSEVLP